MKRKKAEQYTHAQCPKCEEVTTIDKWNQLAKATYGPDSPDLRTLSTNKANTFPYQCPQCFMGYSAYQVKLVQEDELKQSMTLNQSST